jgi:UDP-N-acetylglucosamine--N-acetylmuramyl-(pentapeptide) pyrophosphoryl-undecaprenol N-acetylglucosamine transferase
MRVVLSGGGTGGHVYPALAVATALQQRFAGNGPLELLYIGIRGRLDEELMTSEIMPFRTVRAGALRGRSPWGFIRSLFNLSLGTLEARRYLKQFRPHVVFATGGYASVPVAVAARLSGRPLLVYLPDIRPGWAVRLMGRLAQVIAVTNEASLPYLPTGKTRVTGYPVRKAFTAGVREQSYQRLGLEPDRKTLLIAGGSQGAHSINKMAADYLPQLLRLCQIIHISGASDYQWLADLREKLPETLAERYHLHRYLRDEMPWAMATADLALTRAGASTLGELPAIGLPAVLIPGPFSDQKENARYLSEKGVALTLTNSHLAEAKEEIERLLGDEERLKKMSQAARALAQPDAADRIAELLMEMGLREQKQ